MPQKNDRITLKITAMSADGMGIGKTDSGMAVFVPNTAVGDVAQVIIVKVLKNYCFGKAVEFEMRSNERITPNCDVFSRCGGCCYRHISYEAELKIKQQRVVDAIQRIGKIDVPVLDIIGSDKRDRYRNKAQFPIGKDKDGKAVCGFYSLHSHRIIEQTDCRLQPEEFKAILDITLKFINDFRIPVYDEEKHCGIARHIYLRRSAAGKIMLCLVINADRLPKEMEKELIRRITSQCENVTTVVLNINKKQTGVILGGKNRVLYGDGFITDTLCGVKVKISPLSFYQVNRDTAEKLYEIAADYAQPSGKTVLDLYCGAGTIGLSIAQAAEQIIGVEIVEGAVKDAVYNAKINGIENARFICANASEAAQQLKAEGVKPDVVILDPPRKGAESSLIHTIAEDFSPERVVYVSCDPATLARDLAIFAELGYETKKVRPVDMFPSTSHVETVVLLSHKKPDGHINVKVEFGEGEGKVPLDNIAKRAEEYKPKERVTYKMIKEYIEAKYGFKVHTAYIAEVKRDLGLPMYDAPNAVEELKQPRKHPTAEKVEAIKDALKHFEVI